MSDAGDKYERFFRGPRFYRSSQEVSEEAAAEYVDHLISIGVIREGERERYLAIARGESPKPRRHSPRR